MKYVEVVASRKSSAEPIAEDAVQKAQNFWGRPEMLLLHICSTVVESVLVFASDRPFF